MDIMVLNRDLLSDVARDNDLRILNTWFKKPDSKLISYRIPGTSDLKIIDAKKFTTTDHILCKNWHKHLVLDVEANTTTAFPSDHNPMICTIKNMVFPNRERTIMGPKYMDPSKEEKDTFNNIFKMEMAGKLKEEGSTETDKNGVELLQQSILKAREQAFTPKDQGINKSYISERTMQLREERQRARDKNDGEKERELHRKIRNSVKKDKRTYWATRLEKEDWQEIKQTKKGFMPKYTRLKHTNGVVATSAERPDLLADTLKKYSGETRNQRRQKLPTVKSRNSVTTCFSVRRPPSRQATTNSTSSNKS